MRPFNLEEAKGGKPVCTRDGRDVRILSFDLNSAAPIVATFWNREHSSENAYQFYPNGAFTCCGDTVADLFMKEPEPTLSDYTTIKTYKDACKALGLNKGVTDTISYMSGLSTVPKHIIALMKLETISRALRNGWKPNEEKDLPYLPVFEEKMRCLGAYMSGTIPRLYQETEEKAEYFGTQFIDLWKEYLIVQ